MSTPHSLQYGALGVASLGFEIGDDFYQDCSRFDKIVEINMPALMYTASVAKAPFKTVKGPDILNLDVSTSNNGEFELTGKASDSEMVNSIVGKDFSEFKTGDQDISEVRVYLDVHPDDATSSDTSWLMEPSRRRLVDAIKEEGYRPKRTRTAAAVECSSYTEKKRCKRVGSTLQEDGTWLGVSQICEWFTTDDICGVSSFITETGATTPSVETTTSNSLTDGSINIGEGQSSVTSVVVTASETTTTTPATTETSTTTTEATTTASTVTNAAPPEFTSGDENVQLTFDTNNLSSGRHTLYVQATDSDGYKGPVSSVFIDVSRRKLRGLR